MEQASAVEATKQNINSKRAVIAVRVAILAALVVGVNYVGNHINFVRGDSIGVRLTWITGGSIGVGDYAFFTASHPVIEDGKETVLTKRVACVEGQRIDFDGSMFSCDGTPLGGVLKETSTGVPMERTSFEGIIPEGQVFVLGKHERSLDSRYLGLIEVSRLTRVEPLL